MAERPFFRTTPFRGSYAERFLLCYGKITILLAIYTLIAPTDYLRVDRNRPQVQERIGNLHVKDGEINQPWRNPIRWWLSSATSLWALSTWTIN
jgi:hypothetical protein